MEAWIPVIVIFIYLAVVLYIGIFAFRIGKSTGEDFFLASRSVGSVVFFLSLFATNMTSFAILGSSGAAYKQGIGIFGMMATSSCLVIPLTLFFIGTRLWALGKRFGHMTQVAFFRDRYECSTIGTLIFLLTAAMLVPYLIISIVGGGTILEALTDGKIPYALGGAIVAIVVMGNVFFGGMRGAVWVNVLQTLLFLSFGVVAFLAIGHKLPGGFSGTVNSLLNNPANAKAPSAFAKPATLLTRERIPWQVFLSFMLIPLSSIMFPHMSIMCFTAKRVTAFRKTVVLYPLCIMAIWLPCVFLGALAFNQKSVTAEMALGSEELTNWLDHNGSITPDHVIMADLRKALAQSKEPAAHKLFADVLSNGSSISNADFLKRLNATKDPALKSFNYRIAQTNGDSVLLKMLKANVNPILAGLLAAGIISAVMGSDCHQILALSTMFTKDVFNYYGGGSRMGEQGTVMAGRFFIIVVNGLAYLVALGKPAIFELAVSYAFAGFAAMTPIMVGALFWRRSTKWAALASTLWVAAWILLQIIVAQRHFGPGTTIWSVGATKVLLLNNVGNLSFMGYTLVVPMVLGSTVLFALVSLISPPPSRATIEKYFPRRASQGSFGNPA